MRKARPKPLKKQRTFVVKQAPGSKTRALVTFAGHTEPAAIGRSGISTRKREGDGATPVASMRLLGGYVRHDRLTLGQTALPLRFTRPGMLWCDASGHPAYNRPVTAPFKDGHETLMRDDGLYDVCLVMDWNITSRRRNCGSAIFFHLARPGYTPTEGCIAVRLPAMKRWIRFMTKDTIIRIAR